MQAREAFAAGRYQDALDLFAKLYAESLNPIYLRNIGRCHQNLGEPERAITSFRDYLRKAKHVARRRAQGDRGLHQGDGGAEAVEGGERVERADADARRPSSP